MKTIVEPIGARVLVKRDEAEKVSSGGILLVDSAQDAPDQAIVVSLGVGARDESGPYQFTVNVGDRVIIAKYGGTSVDMEGEEHLILLESDIMGIVRQVE